MWQDFGKTIGWFTCCRKDAHNDTQQAVDHLEIEFADIARFLYLTL